MLESASEVQVQDIFLPHHLWFLLLWPLLICQLLLWRLFLWHIAFVTISLVKVASVSIASVEITSASTAIILLVIDFVANACADSFVYIALQPLVLW